MLPVGADEDIFSFAHHTFFLGDGSIKTEYCLTELLNPKQPTNRACTSEKRSF